MLVSITGIKKFILGLANKIKTYKEDLPTDDKTPMENENGSQTGSNEATEPIEYVIFPQKVINITQRANGAFSHKNLQAWDLADIDSNIQQAFAPCTVIVLAKPTSNANTVLFGSCDEQGNPRAVMTENGTKRILTFALTHDDYIGDIKIGEIYRSGEKIYDEGKAGKATGNHIHIEVAEGWQYEKIRDEFGHYRIKNIIPIGSIFHKLKGWNEIKNANGYTFKEVERRFYDGNNI